jgi:hypothetical protein
VQDDLVHLAVGIFNKDDLRIDHLQKRCTSVGKRVVGSPPAASMFCMINGLGQIAAISIQVRLPPAAVIFRFPLYILYLRWSAQRNSFKLIPIITTKRSEPA